MATFNNTCTGNHGKNYTQNLIVSYGTQDISNNRTWVEITYSRTRASSNYYNYGYDNPSYIYIDGQQVAYNNPKSNHNNEATQVLCTWSGWVTHNDSGSKTINVSAKFSSTSSNLSGGTVSGDVTLPTIPRYASVTNSLSSKTETTALIEFNADAVCDGVWWSIDNGSTWTKFVESDVYGGRYLIEGLSANTTYKVKTRVRRKDSQLMSESSAISVTTYNYPHCTDTPNFTIGDELTLTLYNPLSRLVTIAFIGADGTTLSTDTTAETTVTGYNTETFKNKLYNSIPNSASGKYQIKVTYESSTKTRNNGNTYSIKGTEVPTFTNFTYKDANTNVTSVTGNDQVLVKGLSNLQVTISSANKMVANKGANGNKYIATIDSLNTSGAYSDSNVTLTLGGVANSGTKRLNVSAYDSRNLYKTVYKDIVVYDYAKPVINIDVSRLNNFEAQTTLKVNGTYTKLTINGTDKNSMVSVKYRYRETGGDWSSWVNINTTVVSGKFTCSDVILTLDNTKAFEFEVIATDKLDTNTSDANIDVGEAIFFISSNKKKCYAKGIDIMANANYSTEEEVIGYWIDGREVYKKTFQVNALANATLLKVTHNISNLDMILDIKGMATNGTNFLPLPYLTETTATNISIYANTTEIRISSGNDRSSYKAYVTLVYIKTVD